MSDEELNEIFRAIRHRRTLSWATIEKLANELRIARAAPAKLEPSVFQYPDELTAALERAGWGVRRAYEQRIMDRYLRRYPVMTCNVPPSKPVNFSISDVELIAPVMRRADIIQKFRRQTALHKLESDPLASSEKKE